ncbi:unnamed protein product, partial [Didymodactylos carnosus]
MHNNTQVFNEELSLVTILNCYLSWFVELHYAPLSLHSHFEMTSSTISQYTATASVQRKQTPSSDSSTTSSKHRIRSKSEISYCRKRSIVAEKNVLAKSGQQISVLERLPTLYRDALLPLNVNEAKDQ